jgi:hypothetical protein
LCELPPRRSTGQREARLFAKKTRRNYGAEKVGRFRKLVSNRRGLSSAAASH